MVQWLADLLKGVATFLWEQFAFAAETIWNAISTLFGMEEAARSYQRPKGKAPAPPPPHTVRPSGKTDEPGDDVSFAIEDFEAWRQKYGTWVLDTFSKLPNPGSYFDERFDPFINELAQGSIVRFTLFGTLSFIRYLVGVLDAIADVGIQAAKMRANVFAQQAIPDVSTLAMMGIRYPTSNPIMAQLAEYFGYSYGAFSLMQQSMRQVPDLATQRDLFFRIMPEEGLTTEATKEEALRYLRWQGFSLPDAERILASWHWFPSPLDLVRFVVREVFDPAYRAIHYDPYKPPPKYLELAAKAGMPTDTATWYWDAHWELPSVPMAFEMLHRGVINEEDLDRLLAAQDVMPSWREAIKRISYHPYTRVDIRRMYKLNVLQATDLVRAYKDAGYDEEHAQNLSEFTILDALGKERTAARSTLERLFLRYLLEEQDLRDGYEALRFNQDAIDMMVQELTIRRQDEFLETRTETIHALYIVGDLDEAQARAELAKLGQDPAAADLAVAKWRAERVRLAPKIPVTDLTAWLRNGIITQAYFFSQMTLGGFEAIAIQHYVEGLGLVPDPEVFK